MKTHSRKSGKDADGRKYKLREISFCVTRDPVLRERC